MSAITKERIELFIKNPLDNGLTRGEQMELARIALASLEAEAVATFYKSECGNVFNTLDSWLPVEGVNKLYAAPQLPHQSPVSVPEVVGWEDVPEEVTEDDINLASAWAHGFNQCRAAMLQCADGYIAHEGKSHQEDKLGMVDHFGGSNNMVEPVTDNTNQQFESLSRGEK